LGHNRDAAHPRDRHRPLLIVCIQGSENGRRTFLIWRLPFLACLCADGQISRPGLRIVGGPRSLEILQLSGVEIDESATQCDVEMSMPDSLIADHCHEWREHQDN
jgi:hypothetical protein